MRFSARNLLFIFALLTTGCLEQHLIHDRKYLESVEAQFTEKKLLADNRKFELFDVFNEGLTLSQTEALKFLFAFMPLSDLADYNGEFFLANADRALLTRKQYPWGKEIPEEIFLHYVLPPRVNNENLDSFRIVYYDEISERIKGLDLEQAALEINHWCHEKVTYQPADIRTSGPMSTILSARGRCGEESTFTVSALRTAGIPARQVYTPRWAHTDDNHAWVEIWNNGSWFYLGACEPEPVLDRGWFTEPARRAMLVHTKSFGASYGEEDEITRHRDFTEINNLSKYAVTKKIFVKVSDRLGVPLNNSIVEYQLYNYAEFYPIATVPTDNNGISSFETGLGDLIVWARNGNDFNFTKISVAETDTIRLRLNRKAEGVSSEDLDLDVPVVREPLAAPPEELSDKNAQRISDENKIRQEYVDTWMSSSESLSFASEINTDTALTRGLLAKSMGNYNTIVTFLRGVTEKNRKLALSLLGVISDKDLRDTKLQVLEDHLENVIIPSWTTSNNEFFISYILNPRVSNELLVSWRGYLRNQLPPELISSAASDPSLIADYINKNISISDDDNYYKTPLTPIGVHQLKVSDSDSRAIYFVALCRSLGIPSRLEPGSNIPQFYFNSTWEDVYFSDQEAPSGRRGFLKLFSTDSNPVPEYYIHFTIARFQNGRYNTLEYDYNKRITDFKEELQLPTGHYMLVTGNRLNNGKILSNISFFDLEENQHKTVGVRLRSENPAPEITGTISLDEIDSMLPVNIPVKEKILEKGIVITWIEPEKEPTKHILNDLPLLKKELDSWGGGFLFLTDPGSGVDAINLHEYKGLPGNSFSGKDPDLRIFKTIKSDRLPKAISYPFLILSDKDGNILYTSSGYRIGIGEQILKNIR